MYFHFIFNINCKLKNVITVHFTIYLYWYVFYCKLTYIFKNNVPKHLVCCIEAMNLSFLYIFETFKHCTVYFMIVINSLLSWTSEPHCLLFNCNICLHQIFFIIKTSSHELCAFWFVQSGFWIIKMQAVQMRPAAPILFYSMGDKWPSKVTDSNSTPDKTRTKIASSQCKQHTARQWAEQDTHTHGYKDLLKSLITVATYSIISRDKYTNLKK